MKNRSPAPLQLKFFDVAERDHAAVSIHLVNGIRLLGVIVGADEYTLLLIYRGQVSLVYKHAISSVSPERPLDLMDAEAVAPVSN
jgi:host factor-I protein